MAPLLVKIALLPTQSLLCMADGVHCTPQQYRNLCSCSFKKTSILAKHFACNLSSLYWSKSTTLIIFWPLSSCGGVSILPWNSRNWFVGRSCRMLFFFIHHGLFKHRQKSDEPPPVWAFGGGNCMCPGKRLSFLESIVLLKAVLGPKDIQWELGPSAESKPRVSTYTRTLSSRWVGNQGVVDLCVSLYVNPVARARNVNFGTWDSYETQDGLDASCYCIFTTSNQVVSQTRTPSFQSLSSWHTRL